MGDLLQQGHALPAQDVLEYGISVVCELARIVLSQLARLCNDRVFLGLALSAQHPTVATALGLMKPSPTYGLAPALSMRLTSHSFSFAVADRRSMQDFGGNRVRQRQ